MFDTLYYLPREQVNKKKTIRFSLNKLNLCFTKINAASRERKSKQNTVNHIYRLQ